jgi:hypothetical protein
MFRLTILLVLAALVVPAAASAKGPTEATISGPGFNKTIDVLGDGSGPGAGGDLTEESGFFPGAYGQSPDPMRHRRPAGSLGPRYTIVWKVPAGEGVTSRIRQDLYPYARGGAVTYMKPGQPIFGMTTPGGWYANPELKRTLISVGLPRVAPGRTSGTNFALMAGLGIPGALAAAGVAIVLAKRRRGSGAETGGR